MRAATLREIIAIQKPQPQAEGSDWGPTPIYADEQTVRASVLADGGSEGAGDFAVATAITYTVRLRHLPDLTSTARIRWGTRILDIVSVRDPDGRRRELEIKATENVGVANA